MSWYRQIKTFYTISINMFFFIIWGIISSIFLANKLDYRLYFVSLAAAFLLQLIMNRYEDKAWLKALPALAGIALTFTISRGMHFILNSVFIVFILYVTNKMENEDVNYDAYKARAKNTLILILFMGALLPLVDIALSKSILKFYIMYLISNVVVMREARSYYYKVRNPRSFTFNVFISVAILALSIDIVFEKLLIVIKYIMSIIGAAATALIDLIGLILAKPLLYGIAKLKARLLKTMGDSNISDMLNMQARKKGDAAFEVAWEDSTAQMWLYNVARIVVIIVVLIAVFAIVSKFVSLYGNKETALEEKREKIKREKSSRRSAITRFIKNLIKPGTIREQILNVYKKFEEKTFEKGIFKRPMTAKQLENITKAYVENTNGLNLMTDIYNKAKFSTHEVSESELKDIKESFDKVKKQL